MSKHKFGSTGTFFAAAVALGCSLGLTDEAAARSRFDGAWNLQFVTQRGSCDPTYTFTVNIANGILSHPNLVQFRGQVAPSGAANASVRVIDKVAWGSGKLSNTSGRGHWIGREGRTSCAGYWIAQRSGG